MNPYVLTEKIIKWVISCALIACGIWLLRPLWASFAIIAGCGIGGVILWMCLAALYQWWEHKKETWDVTHDV